MVCSYAYKNKNLQEQVNDNLTEDNLNITFIGLLL